MTESLTKEEVKKHRTKTIPLAWPGRDLPDCFGFVLIYLFLIDKIVVSMILLQQRLTGGSIETYRLQSSLFKTFLNKKNKG